MYPCVSISGVGGDGVHGLLYISRLLFIEMEKSQGRDISWNQIIQPVAELVEWRNAESEVSGSNPRARF